MASYYIPRDERRTDSGHEPGAVVEQDTRADTAAYCVAGHRLDGVIPGRTEVGRSVAALAAAVILSGCGAGRPPEEWARQVCDALVPWRTEISTLNASVQQRMATAGTPVEARTLLVELLSGGEAASERARSAVAAAGTPDVADGDQLAQRFTASLERARDAYAHAKADLQHLPTTDATTFYDGVVAVMSRLTTEYAASAVDPGQIDSPELRRAFDGIDECR